MQKKRILKIKIGTKYIRTDKKNFNLKKKFITMKPAVKLILL